ncbi:MAG: NADH-quinone oxidoreductase subunit C [Alphaproteobacteria bacterium]|nr:NADH-quinone oxidoreductase subunit C [Alphaproteobacteria bacterium]
MTGTLNELGEHVAHALPGAVRAQSVALGELTLTVDRARIVEAMTFLRDDPRCRFKLVMDVCGADYPERAQRFEVVYHLLSLEHNRRLRVKVATDEATPVPSVVGVFNAANWFEREAWDLYGILFADHPDLRRILTDYGFEGHPLRKDFPLTGYVEVRYDDEKKRVVYEPVRLTQDFRSFDFLSPWEGMTRQVLPGDEKAAAPAAPPGPAKPGGAA